MPETGPTAPEPGRVGRLLPAAFRSRLDLEPPDPEPAVEEAGSAFTLRAFAPGYLFGRFHRRRRGL